MSTGIIKAGRNVWKSVRADQVMFLVDGKNYYRQLQDTLGRASRSIWIIGWDFNPFINLNAGNGGDALALGEFLRALVTANDALEIRILIWGEGPIYSGRTLRLFGPMEWASHPRITLQFDFVHPLRASHHQKLVCVDESLAFVGGMDLTAGRWDDRRHLPGNPERVTPDGNSYPPTHDVQTLVTGEAASALAEVARRRWRHSTGEHIPAHGPVHHEWPDGLQAHISGCKAGIALTEPGAFGRRRRTEIARLTYDAVNAAARCIYIEAQYLASPGLTRRLVRKLRDPNGPDVIIISTRTARGVFEQMTMGTRMARDIHKLRSADIFGRLSICYPVVPKEDGSEEEILIHSKVVIVDDHFLRVGSSNLNNRSEGFDTECDLAIEAEVDTTCRNAIVDLRNDLISEHLEVDKAHFAQAAEKTGSVVAALNALNNNDRGLRLLPAEPEAPGMLTKFVIAVLDPRMPYWPLQRLGPWVASLQRRFNKTLRAVLSLKRQS